MQASERVFVPLTVGGGIKAFKDAQVPVSVSVSVPVHAYCRTIVLELCKGKERVLGARGRG